MKKYESPWSVGSLFICNKCGKNFTEPEMAENLKTELRSNLKSIDAHKKIRVMVSGCLNVCMAEEQAFVYQSNSGPIETYTVGDNFKDNVAELWDFLEKKLK